MFEQQEPLLSIDGKIGSLPFTMFFMCGSSWPWPLVSAPLLDLSFITFNLV